MQAEVAQLAQISTGDAAAFGQWASSVESSLRGSLRPFAARCDTEAVLQEALLLLKQARAQAQAAQAAALPRQHRWSCGTERSSLQQCCARAWSHRGQIRSA